MSLNDFLIYLAGVGAIAAISWLWEYFGWFADMEAKNKKLVLFGFSAVVALGAYAVQVYVPSAILDQIAPFFLIVSSIFVYLFVGDGFHKVTK